MKSKIVTSNQQLEIKLNIKNKFLSNLKKPIFKNKGLTIQIRGIHEVYLCNLYLLTMNIHVLIYNQKNNILCVPLNINNNIIWMSRKKGLQSYRFRFLVLVFSFTFFTMCKKIFTKECFLSILIL